MRLKRKFMHSICQPHCAIIIRSPLFYQQNVPQLAAQLFMVNALVALFVFFAAYKTQLHSIIRCSLKGRIASRIQFITTDNAKGWNPLQFTERSCSRNAIGKGAAKRNQPFVFSLPELLEVEPQLAPFIPTDFRVNEIVAFDINTNSVRAEIGMR